MVPISNNTATELAAISNTATELPAISNTATQLAPKQLWRKAPMNTQHTHNIVELCILLEPHTVSMWTCPMEILTRIQELERILPYPQASGSHITSPRLPSPQHLPVTLPRQTGRGVSVLTEQVEQQWTHHLIH